MRYRTKKRIIIVVCVLLVAASLWLGSKYASFRSETNYCFASVADFFQQIFSRNKVKLEFVDQNVDEQAIGEYRLRTMKVRLIDGEFVVRAVAVDTLFGTYYRFPGLDFDVGMIKFGTSDDGEHICTDKYTLFFDDGTLIEVLSDYHITDNYGGPLITIENNDTFYKDYPYSFYFWIPGELPTDYQLTCEEDSSYGFTYDEVIKS